MNPEQVKSLVRSVLGAFGGMLAGWFAAKGWISSDQVLAILNSETFLGVVVSVIVGVWGLFVHKESNQVAVVAALAQKAESPVQAVITTPNRAGEQLANEVASGMTPGTSTIAPAGTPKASVLAGVG